MLVRLTRWFLIGAPVLAGLLLLAFGTQGTTSQAFGATLISIGACIWLWNVFVRMTINETTREEEAAAREERGPSRAPGPPRTDPSPPDPPRTDPPRTDPPRSDPGDRPPAHPPAQPRRGLEHRPRPRRRPS